MRSIFTALLIAPLLLFVLLGVLQAEPVVPPELEGRIRSIMEQRSKVLDDANDDIRALNGALDIIESNVDTSMRIATATGEWMAYKKQQAEKAWLNDLIGLGLSLLTGGTVVGGAAMIARRRVSAMPTALAPTGFRQARSA